MTINTECGKRLKECRMAAGLSQKEFAELVNYSAQQICYIENGKRALSEEAADIFSEKLGVRANYLLCKDSILFDNEKREELTTNYQKINCLDLLLNFADYELYDIPEAEKEASGINLMGDPMPLNKGSILKTPNNNLFYCSNELLDELTDDIMNYAIMRLEKWLLPKCSRPTSEELNAARLTPEGEYIPKKVKIKVPRFPELRKMLQPDSKLNNENDSTKTVIDLLKEIKAESFKSIQEKKTDD